MPLLCIVLYIQVHIFQFFQNKCRHGLVGPPVFSWPGGGTCGYEEYIEGFVLSSLALYLGVRHSIKSSLFLSSRCKTALFVCFVDEGICLCGKVQP